MAMIVQYMRWSSTEQSSGDSLRRQRDMVAQYLASHPDDHAQPQFIYIDKGMSGFKKKPVQVADGEWIEQSLNRSTGELKRLFDDIRNGKIPRGSKLCVEAFDRLSRAEPFRAFADIGEIVDAGITIVTLQDGAEYDSTSLSRNMSHLMMVLMKSFVAFEESLKKSERGLAVAEGKYQLHQLDGKPMKFVTPGWLRLADGVFIVDEAKAEIVRMIFNYRMQGDSFYRIAIRLNEARTPTINHRMIRSDRRKKILQLQAEGKDAYAGDWSRESVKYLLQSETVIGTKPETPSRPAIKDYYPAIIDMLTFRTVQDMSQGKPRGKCSTTDSPIYLNIFRTLLTCGDCGLTMTPSAMRAPLYYGVYRCNSFVERRQRDPNASPSPVRSRGAGRRSDAIQGTECRTASRKAFDINLCRGLFAYLKTISGNTTDHVTLSRLETLKAEKEKVITNLTQTIVSLAAVGVPPDVLKQMGRVKKELNQIEKDIKSEYLKADVLNSNNLGNLDLLNSKADRAQAQSVILKLVRKITIYGSRQTCDIHLYNGSVICNFEYLKEYDATWQFQIATDDERIAEWNMLAGVSGGITVNAAKPQEVDSFPDMSEWPEVESDYPNKDD
ncbi:recombinase family protein [Pantoea sp. C8B4]|uniref:recombinase family protein n=1 Tax=Pantoea sp. C8B4 TaxID=3243083 RepID=UPI003EDA52CD